MTCTGWCLFQDTVLEGWIHYRCRFCCENISSSVNQKWWPCCMLLGAAFPPSWKKCLLEGWLNKMPACLQNGSCQPSAKWGEEVEPQFKKSYACPCGPSKISAPYMAGNSVRVEAVREDLILAECSLTPLRVPEWSWGQGLSDCWLLALPQLWEAAVPAACTHVMWINKSHHKTDSLSPCPGTPHLQCWGLRWGTYNYIEREDVPFVQ